MIKRLPLNIILLGDPAAGKATQSKLLLASFPLYDLDMGKELRKLRSGKSELARRIKETVDVGNLAPTDIVRTILEDRITTVPERKGILFDGNPKMVGEAKLVAKLLKGASRTDPVVIYLSIPMKETVSRMLGRKEYHDGKYSKRSDDNETALKNRVKYYRVNIAEVLSFFRTKYEFKKINGLGSVDEVHARIMKAIGEFIKNQR